MLRIKIVDQGDPSEKFHVNSEDLISLNTFLRSEDYLTRKIIIKPYSNNMITIQGKNTAGIVKFGSFQLIIQPKILGEERTILEALSLIGTIDMVRLDHGTGLVEPSNMLDLIFLIFLGQIEELLRRGIYRGYVTNTSELTFLRGKIKFAESMNSLKERNRLMCEYDIYIGENIENQIICTVLKYGLDVVDNPRIKSRTLHYYRQFKNFTSQLPFPFNFEFEQLSYNSKNFYYRPVHQTAKFILEQLSIVDFTKSGGLGFNFSWLVDTPKLFEKLIERLFISLCSDKGIQQPIYQDRLKLKFSNKTRIFPNKLPMIDLYIKDANLIVDMKYKNITKDKSINWSDIYQIMSYKQIKSTNSAILLVYPYAGENEFEYYSTELINEDQQFITKLHVWQISVPILIKTLMKKKSRGQSSQYNAILKEFVTLL